MKKIILYGFPFFLFILFCYPAFTQNRSKTDSLQQLIKTSTDTNKVNALIKLSSEYADIGLPEKARETAVQAQALSEKLGFQKGIANGILCQAVVLLDQGDLRESISYFEKALRIGVEIHDSSIQASCLNKIGTCYRNLGDYTQSLDYHFKALKILEVSDKWELGSSLSGIGVVYHLQKNHPKAIEYLLKSIKVAEETGNKRVKSRALINLSQVYYGLKDYKNTSVYNEEGLKLATELKDSLSIAIVLSNMGELYNTLKQYDKGYEYSVKAMRMSKSLGDKEGLAYTAFNIGNSFTGFGKYDLAEKSYLEAIDQCKKLGIKELMKDSYSALSDLYEKKYDFKKAHEYFKLFSAVKDTLLNKENSRIITEIDTKYSTEKKEKEIELLKKNENIQEIKLAKHKSDLNRQRIISFSAFIGVTLLLLLALLLFNRYKIKQKANDRLQIAYEQIEEKNKVIEKANLQITDSIEYAKKIQDAILPDQQEIQKFLPESFVLFKPRDVVSGDFYWFSGQNEKIIIAVADCTGHGVPGAFMSMIGNTLLNEIVNEKKISEPARILEMLNDGIVNALHQSRENDSEPYDGMEIGICSFDMVNKKIFFSGSRNNLYVINDDSELVEIKGDRDHIGGSLSQGSKIFSSHSLPLTAGTKLYLFTDGFMDQTGGANNKRFYSDGFKKLLLEIKNHPIPTQKELMESAFEQWKGTQKQRDDVLVIGIKC